MGGAPSHCAASYSVEKPAASIEAIVSRLQRHPERYCDYLLLGLREWTVVGLAKKVVKRLVFREYIGEDFPCEFLQVIFNTAQHDLFD